jgi:MFS family permease
VTTLAQHASRQTLPVPETAANLDRQNIFTRVLISRFLFLLGTYGIGHFLLYFVRDRLHLASAAGTTSVLLTLFTAETALIAIGSGVLSDRLGRLPVLWGAAACSVLGPLLLIPANTIGMVLVGGSVLGIGSGLFASANWALTADLAPRGAGGQTFGMLAVATGAATALAGLFGILVDHTGYNPLFVAAALTSLGSAVALPRAAQVARVVYPAAAHG